MTNTRSYDFSLMTYAKLAPLVIYLAERVVGLESLGVKDYLPDLTGRTIYLAYHKSVRGRIRELIPSISPEQERFSGH